MTEEKRVSVQKKIEQDIRDYGQPVLDSEIWSRAIHQIHHNHWTVGSHSMSVCIAALRFSYYLENRGVKTDRRKITRAALCHDLGIVGRDEKFANNRVCCIQHPKDSVPIAMELYPDIDEDTLAMIRSHMWPLAIEAPSSIEGLIVSLADKYAATGEGIPVFWIEKYHKQFNQFILFNVQTNPDNRISVPVKRGESIQSYKG